jgi:hypothetical protein
MFPEKNEAFLLTVGLWSEQDLFIFSWSMCIERHVVHLVEAVLYKLEGRGFNSRWCKWNFLLSLSFRLHYGPGVDSASNRHEYQEYFLGGKGSQCLGLSTLSPSCANCLETSWNPQSLSRLVQELLYLYLYHVH